MIYKCQYCDREFIPLKGNIKKGWGKFCSDKCKNKSKRCHPPEFYDGIFNFIKKHKRCSQYSIKKHFRLSWGLWHRILCHLTYMVDKYLIYEYDNGNVGVIEK